MMLSSRFVKIAYFNLGCIYTLLIWGCSMSHNLCIPFATCWMLLWIDTDRFQPCRQDYLPALCSSEHKLQPSLRSAKQSSHARNNQTPQMLPNYTLCHMRRFRKIPWESFHRCSEMLLNGTVNPLKTEKNGIQLTTGNIPKMYLFVICIKSKCLTIVKISLWFVHIGSNIIANRHRSPFHKIERKSCIQMKLGVLFAQVRVHCDNRPDRLVLITIMVRLHLKICVLVIPKSRNTQ